MRTLNIKNLYFFIYILKIFVSQAKTQVSTWVFSAFVFSIFFCLALPHTEQVSVVESGVSFSHLPGFNVFLLCMFSNGILVQRTHYHLTGYPCQTPWLYITLFEREDYLLWWLCHLFLRASWSHEFFKALNNVCSFLVFERKKETSLLFHVSLSCLRAYLVSRCQCSYGEKELE